MKNANASDFSKRAPLTDLPKLGWIWESIPKQLAKEALNQINVRKYDSCMREWNVRRVLKYSVAFSGKKVEIEADE